MQRIDEGRTGEERAELEAVLTSGIFSRAPALAHMLRYICERSFAGEAGGIKEYNIAVEALNRPPGFDQKKDSIVRVEAHRLRKRLKEYYQSEGAGRTLRIEIPSGSYAPVFVRNRNPEPEQEQAPIPAPRLSPRAKVWWPLFAAVAAVAMSLAVLAAWQGRGPAPAAATDVGENAALATLSEVRIRCGAASPHTDPRGNVWVSDRFYEGGRAVQRRVEDVQGVLSPELLSGYRLGSFRYSIPLKPGVYELTLYFSEPSVNAVTDRLFDVRVNGNDILTEFDILAEAGATDVALVKVWKDIQPGEDGILRLEFADRRSGALLNAIILTPGTPGRLRPIRIAAREQPYTDSTGRLFTEDQHFSSGRLVKRIEGISGTDDAELYRGERFGHFSYVIPVPPDSTYTAVLHFAETWFGGTGGGGPGSRMFDVYCNGARLLSNFDPLAEIGTPFQASARAFPGLKPTPNGRLVFQFVPSRNYAMINALEILDEGDGAKPAPASAP
jgi:hypothetical protein